ncbi:MAG: hypothetical protein H6872_14445 [Methylobacteriaceae bacterium]|nr:hypothetical protein [Methylobacteriaceae bacterium]
MVSNFERFSSLSAPDFGLTAGFSCLSSVFVFASSLATSSVFRRGFSGGLGGGFVSCLASCFGSIFGRCGGFGATVSASSGSCLGSGFGSGLACAFGGSGRFGGSGAGLVSSSGGRGGGSAAVFCGSGFCRLVLAGVAQPLQRRGRQRHVLLRLRHRRRRLQLVHVGDLVGLLDRLDLLGDLLALGNLAEGLVGDHLDRDRFLRVVVFRGRIEREQCRGEQRRMRRRRDDQTGFFPRKRQARLTSAPAR